VEVRVILHWSPLDLVRMVVHFLVQGVHALCNQIFSLALLPWGRAL
jgi:hypothetical protein